MTMSRSIEYQCEHCGGIFNLPPFTAVTAPHMMGKKLVKCPRCGMTAWVSPIRRDR
jgi:DNA-directed RNA polymerase subunit RPC12/RpoP